MAGTDPVPWRGYVQQEGQLSATSPINRPQLADNHSLDMTSKLSMCQEKTKLANLAGVPTPAGLPGRSRLRRSTSERSAARRRTRGGQEQGRYVDTEFVVKKDADGMTHPLEARNGPSGW